MYFNFSKKGWIIVLLLVVLPFFLMAQKPRKKKPPQKQVNSKYTCPIKVPGKYPFHGFGLRVGDPTGITYKLFIIEHLSFELVGGIVPSGLYRDHFIDVFETAPAFEDFTYQAHRTRFDAVVQPRIILQHNFPFMEDALLDYYYGVGFRYRSYDVNYNYQYERTPGNLDFASENLISDSYGFDLFFGLEYAYARKPIAGFVEIGYYQQLEGLLNISQIIGGVGVRYHISGRRF